MRVSVCVYLYLSSCCIAPRTSQSRYNCGKKLVGQQAGKKQSHHQRARLHSVMMQACHVVCPAARGRVPFIIGAFKGRWTMDTRRRTLYLILLNAGFDSSSLRYILIDSSGFVDM